LDRLYIEETSAKITPAGVANSSAVLHPAGTVVLSRDAGVGKSAIMRTEMAVSQHFMAWQCGPHLDNHFLYYWLQAEKAEFERIAIGNTIKTIGLAYFRSLCIPHPPLREQRAIAEALSDVDALLGALDRLIAKKRDIKQAAMQQLLTGQTRLPGFSGEWEVKPLGSIFEISAGKSKSAYITASGEFVICDMGSVSTDGRLITSKRTNYHGDFLLKGDLVMPKDDIGGGKIIGRVGYVDAPDRYVLGDHVYCLRAREGDPLFFSYLINSHSINSALRKKVIGSAQLGLGRRSVAEQEISAPSLTEQRAIATILSDMDAELEALKQRRAKTAALKQGMMQELLTGRTRLV
jgi:type I restriction enzyme S subunit